MVISSSHLFKNFYLNKTDDHFLSENLHFLNIRITWSVAFIFRQERNRRKGDLKQNLVVQNLELLFKIRDQFSPYTKMYVGRKNRSYPNWKVFNQLEKFKTNFDQPSKKRWERSSSPE